MNEPHQMDIFEVLDDVAKNGLKPSDRKQYARITTKGGRYFIQMPDEDKPVIMSQREEDIWRAGYEQGLHDKKYPL